MVEKKTAPKKGDKQERPLRGGLLKRTLQELQELGIQLRDVFTIKGVTINLSWDQVIKLVNFNAGKTVIGWDNTFEEAIKIINIFLM